MTKLSLRPYQAQGIDFLADRGRAALFDEPGLGKTMQSLLAMRDIAPVGPLLVVAPGEATGVWQDEADLWLDEQAVAYSGVGAQLSGLEYDGIVVTNYHRLHRVLEYDIEWQGFIFDESQALRNRKTRTLFASLKAAAKWYKGVPMFFLSGTPVVKAAGDLWPILHMINKAKYGSYWSFVNKWANTWQDHHGWHVEGVTNVRAMWTELSEVVLRRDYEDVGLQVPKINRQRIRLKMTSQQAKAYRDLEADMIHELPNGGMILTPTVLAREMRLRQLLTMPRLLGIDDDGAALTAFRDTVAETPRPFVLFTPFPSAFKYIEPFLGKLKRPMYFIEGGMHAKIHATAKRFVSESKDNPILVVSTHMGKAWSAAPATRLCYHLGWDWNNTTMLQAERRLARPPQIESVFSNYFVHDDTHDTDALAILAGKRRLSDAILDRVRRKLR